MERVLLALKALPESTAVVNLVIALLGATSLALLFIFITHTMYIFGQNSIIYRKRQPIPGWNKRFYPAIVGLILFLLTLIWALSVWSHSLTNS